MARCNPDTGLGRASRVSVTQIFLAGWEAWAALVRPAQETGWVADASMVFTLGMQVRRHLASCHTSL